MDENVEVLRWLVADIVARGPRSWTAEELHKKYGEAPIDYLLSNEFLAGEDNLCVTDAGVYYVMMGGVPHGPSLKAKRDALGPLVTHFDLRDVFAAQGMAPAKALPAATSVFGQLMHNSIHGIEFICSQCLSSYGVCGHDRSPGGWYYHNAKNWLATAESVIGVTEHDLRDISPVARERTLILRDHLVAAQPATR